MAEPVAVRESITIALKTGSYAEKLDYSADLFSLLFQ